MDKVSGKSTKVILLTAQLWWESGWVEKKEGFSTKVAILLSCTVLWNALCLGRQALKGCCLALATCLIYRHFFSWREGTHWIDSFCNFLPLHHCTFSSPCFSHSALIVAKAAWRTEERLEKLLSETEQRKVAWYTFSNGLTAMFCSGAIIASWIPSIYILS